MERLLLLLLLLLVVVIITSRSYSDDLRHSRGPKVKIRRSRGDLKEITKSGRESYLHRYSIVVVGLIDKCRFGYAV